jgi:phospholipid/cholesterol/gamma-HCH transport system substrate-binding protein
MPARQHIQWAKFRVAATAFSALLILGVVLVLLTGGTLFRKMETLRVFVPDASGIGPGASVRLNGIPVGEITGVRLSGSPNPDRVVEVTFEIERRHLELLPSDSVATTTAENIQGDKFLDITRGGSPVPATPGGELHYQPAPDVLKSLDLVQFERRMRAIDDLFAEIQAGKGSLGELLMKDNIYVDVVTRIARIQESMRTAASTERALGRLLYLDTRYEEIAAPIRKLDEALARVQNGEGTAGRLLTSSAQYDDMLKRLTTLRRQLAELNAGQGRAGRFLVHDGMYEDWTRRVSRVVASIDAFNSGDSAFGRLTATTHTYETLNGSLRELQRTLDDLRHNPQKYLRLKVF